MSHHFNDSLVIEAKYQCIAERYMDQAFGFSRLTCVNKKGHDYEGYTLDGTHLFLEIKVRETVYSDILIETISNDITEAPGWIIYSDADVLVYLFIENQKVSTRSLILNMQELKDWFRPRFNDYPQKYAQNPGYKTVFHIVPINELPERVFYQISGIKLE